MDLFSAKFLVVAIVALVVLGPEKLPGALRGLGRLVSELRRVSAGLGEQTRAAADQAGLAEPLAELRSASELLRNPLGSATPAPATPPGPPRRPEPGPPAEIQPLVTSGTTEQGGGPECS